MTSLLPQFYELLKKAVLTKSGIVNITPCDCKSISINIFNKTKQSISETTLKRIYGFAYSKFKPSLFSIDVMAKYCGYTGWDDFCQKHSKNVKPGGTVSNWDTVKRNAFKTTNFTLQVLRNKSGIPYNQTIKRRFINNHLNEFLNLNESATIFAAPAGYGKTIALCHWVEERLIQNEQGETNDIILFFSISALANVLLNGQDLNHWLLSLLGYSPDADISALLDTGMKKEGNFFLIIDDLDESICKPEQFKLLIRQIADLLNLCQNENWLKVVLTMRSASWINNRHELEGNNKWFKGFMPTDNTAINVPLLNVQELEELCYNINPGTSRPLTQEIAENFEHPLYLQFYYKQHRDNFDLGNADHVCIYELISTFVLNKVYLGSQSAEKILFLKGLVEVMEVYDNKYQVAKTKINPLIKQYHHAYIELINIGFIREINNSTDLHYDVFIQFTNSKFFEYTYAKALLQENDLLFDHVLINEINERFEDSDHKLPILKWCILYTIRTGQQKNFDLLIQTKLTLNQKSDLILFMGDLFEKEYALRSRSESLTQYFKQDCSTELFNYFFGLEFLNYSYKKTLLSLLKFNLKNRKRILIYTALATSAVMRLDLASLEEYLVILRAIPHDDYNKFAINPLHCLEALYSYLKNGIIEKQALIELTQFYFNPPIEGSYFDNNVVNDIIYLLGAHSLLITQNPRKIQRFIRVLDKYYKKNDLSALAGYHYFMNVLIADCHFRLGQKEEMHNIYAAFSDLYKSDKNAFTNYMKNMYYAMRIKANSLFKNYKHIIEDTTSHAQVSGQHRISRMVVLSVILNNPEIAALYPKFCKQCQFEYSRLFRESGINTELFMKDLFFNKS
jgi:hypothetical protein